MREDNKKFKCLNCESKQQMANDTNLKRLKEAYQAWHETKGGSTDVWLDLMCDEVCVHNIGEEAAGLSFAKDRQSKQEFVDYLASILEEWKMIHWTSENYVNEGDRIAMFGHCAWTNIATGKDMEVRVAHLWEFRDGQVVDYTEIFDSARATAAANA